MVKFDKLYALDKKGKVRVFEITVDPYYDKYLITTGTGLLEGKITEKQTEVSKGKGGRTIKEQAELQANSKYNEKLDEGYKSYNTLAKAYNVRLGPSQNRIFYTNDSAEEDWMIEEVMKGVTWNTNRNWDPLPMLAEPYSKVKKHINYPVIGQPKLDGVRCIAQLRKPGNPNSTVKLCSRGGKYYEGLTEIEEELKIVFQEDYYMMLDGELYVHGVTQNQISGEARRKKRDMFQEQWLEYHIYDIPIIGGGESDQDNREYVRKSLKSELESKNLKFIKFIDGFYVHSESDAKIRHDQYVADGYEGLILRDRKAPYMFSFRDKCLIKLKDFVVEEFTCRGYTCQTGDISTFTLTLSDGDGTVFGCRCKGSHALWQKYLDDPPIGRKVKVRYINRSAINNVPEKATVLPLSDYDKWD